MSIIFDLFTNCSFPTATNILSNYLCFSIPLNTSLIISSTNVPCEVPTSSLSVSIDPSRWSSDKWPFYSPERRILLSIPICPTLELNRYSSKSTLFECSFIIAQTPSFHPMFSIFNKFSSRRSPLDLPGLVHKQPVLRTRLLCNAETDEVNEQRVECPRVDVLLSEVHREEDFDEIPLCEETNAGFFDVNEGDVFRCHGRSSIDQCECRCPPAIGRCDLQLPSRGLRWFIRASVLRTSTSCLFKERTSAKFLHSIYIDMDKWRELWKEHFNGFEKTLVALPFDHRCSSSSVRSGCGSTINVQLSLDVVDGMLKMLNSCELTLFQLGLSSFFVFLFKLSEETDLCVVTGWTNRCRSEVEDLIGFFVNVVPCETRLDGERTFERLVDGVREGSLSMVEHGDVLHQDIVRDTSIGHLQTLFDVQSRHDDDLIFEDECFFRPFGDVRRRNTVGVSKFDLTCSLCHHVTNRSICLTLEASTDVFLISTIERLAHHFHSFLEQLFTSSTKWK